ncbi:BadM/Rrf2 family transcriptional regulator [Psychrobacillus insolitus]|uniref:BadM/Rrf2 family transcriptional regulator n=1 Tax=Psychrobacillus insolitus TaxID=1461 RepID=A0A2W7MI58_9BACI|nr:Rrf2 family transcriptional regulator [Psychrobacillus insolitus]PZX02451.1 BadM/Rrf2 family transcriptional regulator [Psychrobacillus insolitus]
MINTRLAIGIHILAFVECVPEKDSINSEIVSESIGTNAVVVRRMSSALKKAGLLKSVSIKKGLMLAKKPENITLYEILKAVDPSNDLFIVHQKVNPQCTYGHSIVKVIENEFRFLQFELEENLKKKTLHDIMKKVVNN